MNNYWWYKKRTKNLTKSKKKRYLITGKSECFLLKIIKKKSGPMKKKVLIWSEFFFLILARYSWKFRRYDFTYVEYLPFQSVWLISVLIIINNNIKYSLSEFCILHLYPISLCKQKTVNKIFHRKHVPPVDTSKLYKKKYFP